MWKIVYNEHSEFPFEVYSIITEGTGFLSLRFSEGFKTLEDAIGYKKHLMRQLEKLDEDVSKRNIDNVVKD